MRQLTEEETKAFFEKLAKYIGGHIKYLIDRQDEPYVFRVIKDRCYYMSEKMMKLSTAFGRDELMHCGICFGKFSKTGKFRLHITALSLIASHALYKVWLKPSGENNFVFGNHALKAHIARMTENTPKYSGIIVCSANDVPIGFGVLGRSTDEQKTLDPTTIVIFNQADVGEYLRNEDLQISTQTEG